VTTTTDQYRLKFAGARLTTGPTSDLLGHLRAVQADVETQTGRLNAMTAGVDVDGVKALIAWALRQDFGPDGAERIRREAWS
jgi:hypothetical protein